MTNAQRARRVEMINRKYEAKFFATILAAMRITTRGLIAALRSGGVSAGNRYLHHNVGGTTLATRVRLIYRTVGVEHANRVWEDLQQQASEKRFGFNADWANEVIKYLEKYLIDKITFTVTDNMRDDLLKKLSEGVEQGLGIDEMVKRLQANGEWGALLRYRVARIVRTEIKRAGEVGGKVASDQFPYEQNKEWIAITDNRVRGRKPKDHADHLHMNGQVVDSEGVFRDPRNNHELLFPGDPKGAAEDTINCRCTTAYVARRDSTGRMIPKRSQGRVAVLRPAQSQGVSTRRRVSVIMPQ